MEKKLRYAIAWERFTMEIRSRVFGWRNVFTIWCRMRTIVSWHCALGFSGGGFLLMEVMAWKNKGHDSSYIFTLKPPDREKKEQHKIFLSWLCFLFLKILHHPSNSSLFFKFLQKKISLSWFWTILVGITIKFTIYNNLQVMLSNLVFGI